MAFGTYYVLVGLIMGMPLFLFPMFSLFNSVCFLHAQSFFCYYIQQD